VSSRFATWLGWSLAFLPVVMFVASIPLFFLGRSAHVPSSWVADLTTSGLSLVYGSLMVTFVAIYFDGAAMTQGVLSTSAGQ
jgi:hypothetical protein